MLPQRGALLSMSVGAGACDSMNDEMDGRTAARAGGAAAGLEATTGTVARRPGMGDVDGWDVTGPVGPVVEG